jgi:RNA polymerase sigma-70 factor (ECF subfamily)
MTGLSIQSAVLRIPFQRRGEATRTQDERYARASETFGAALERVAEAFEADPDLQRDLLQDIHLALWRSLARFDGRCSERTWVYRVAHNVAASHVIRHKRSRLRGMATLEDLANHPDPAQPDPEFAAGEHQAMQRLSELVRALDPPDRQIVVLYLEGLDAAAIGDICGLSPGAVSTKVYRLKTVLAHRFQHPQGGPS